jgi:hypothetical protein
MTLQYADFPDPQSTNPEFEPTLPEAAPVASEWPEMAELALSPYNQDLATAGHVPAWPLE